MCTCAMQCASCQLFAHARGSVPSASSSTRSASLLLPSAFCNPLHVPHQLATCPCQHLHSHSSPVSADASLHLAALSPHPPFRLRCAAHSPLPSFVSPPDQVLWSLAPTPCASLCHSEVFFLVEMREDRPTWDTPHHPLQADLQALRRSSFFSSAGDGAWQLPFCTMHPTHTHCSSAHFP